MAKKYESKHLLVNKVEKKDGVTLKIKGNQNVSILFPKIKYPQYWLDNVCYTISNDEELEEAFSKYPKKLEYGGELLIKKGTKEAKAVKDLFDKMHKYYKLDKAKKGANNPLIDGDVKADEKEALEKNGDSYRGCWVLKIKSKIHPKTGKKRFETFSRYKNSKGWLPESDMDINGWFVNVGIYVDFYDYQGNTGLGANMNAIQFMEQNPNLDFSRSHEDDFDYEDEVDDNDPFIDDTESTETNTPVETKETNTPVETTETKSNDNVNSENPNWN